MADKIVVMQGGHIEQVGTPLELYDRPRNTFVATFIGSPAMNMLDAEWRGGAVRFADGTAFDPRMAVDLPDGTKIVFGIRPEHLDIVEAEGIEARVTVIEPTGSETVVFARLADGTEIVGVFRERHDLATGQTIHLAPREGWSHVFDAATGLRVEAPTLSQAA